MTKKEVIWREILVQARENRKTVFTQKELASAFSFSLSTVFNALKIPRASHIVEVSGRNFRLHSHQKLLYLWASARRPQKDIIFSARIELEPARTEALMPPLVEFGFYSAFALAYGEKPADYDHIYVYINSSDLPEIIERLPEHKLKDKNPNFFVLKKDPWLSRYGRLPLEQTFVDIWNAPEWYAKDFLGAIENKLNLTNS